MARGQYVMFKNLLVFFFFGHLLLNFDERDEYILKRRVNEVVYQIADIKKPCAPWGKSSVLGWYM